MLNKGALGGQRLLFELPSGTLVLQEVRSAGRGFCCLLRWGFVFFSKMAKKPTFKLKVGIFSAFEGFFVFFLNAKRIIGFCRWENGRVSRGRVT